MNPGHAHLSLSDFKEKTDRQLIILVRNQIEQSLRLARRNPGPDAEALYRQAEKLLAVARPSETERVELESLLAQVREALDARPHRAMTSARSAWC